MRILSERPAEGVRALRSRLSRSGDAAGSARPGRFALRDHLDLDLAA
jgi:hypothetical protein